MNSEAAVKTMRLRFPGTCGGCGDAVDKGETAHYLPATKVVRCTSCGPGVAEVGKPVAVPPVAPVQPVPASGTSEAPADACSVELVQGELPRPGACEDCGRRLKRGNEALFDASGTAILCLECVTLDTVHSVGVPGGGARREHAKRLERHHNKVRTAHPKLGGLILVLSDDPSHVRAWQTGAVGEEEFGRRLSGMACEALKVLHDRKVPRSSANVDHLAVTTEAVWAVDAKRYKGKVETRGHGLFSRRPPDLYVGGRNQMKLVEGVIKQVEVVREALASFAAERDLADVPVRGALVFVHAEFGLFPSPFMVDGVWVGWGKAIRQRLAEQTTGELPAGDLAKRLARELRAG